MTVAYQPPEAPPPPELPPPPENPPELPELHPPEDEPPEKTNPPMLALPFVLRSFRAFLNHALRLMNIRATG